jgi:SAM-dependent methyltransferase
MVWAGLFFIIVMSFGYVLLFGPPYVPTLKPQIKSAFDLLDLKPNQTIIELGSGDGRVLIYAAKNGFNAIGYELNPILFIVSFFLTFKYRGKIKIYLKNFWNAELPEADGVFTFLLSRQMRKLDDKLEIYPYKPIKLVSFAFKIQKKQITKQKNGVFLYIYK